MTDSTFVLTEQQKDFFDTFGFLSFPGLMADRINDISNEFEALWARHGGGHGGRQHEGKARSCLVPFIDQSEILSALLDEPRILAIAEGLLGSDFNYMSSDGNYYVGDTGWHSDRFNAEIRHVKIAFYLDPITRATGALRVMPGSHRIEDSYAQLLQEKIGSSAESWGIPGSEVPAVALETQPGDIVCFNFNAKHSAWGGSQRRRMFTINLAQRYPEDRLDDLHNYISSGARFWLDRFYGETMMRTADARRLRHLEQIMANDSHLPELTRQAKAKMAEPSRG